MTSMVDTLPLHCNLLASGLYIGFGGKGMSWLITSYRPFANFSWTVPNATFLWCDAQFLSWSVKRHLYDSHVYLALCWSDIPHTNHWRQIEKERESDDTSTVVKVVNHQMLWHVALLYVVALLIIVDFMTHSGWGVGVGEIVTVALEKHLLGLKKRRNSLIIFF